MSQESPSVTLDDMQVLNGCGLAWAGPGESCSSQAGTGPAGTPADGAAPVATVSGVLVFLRALISYCCLPGLGSGEGIQCHTTTLSWATWRFLVWTLGGLSAP